MNKEEAKKQIAGRLELASRLDDPLAGGQKSAFGDNLLAIVDAIEVEHKPVFLPQKVGKQWTKLVSHYWSSQSADDIWSGTNYALGRLRALGELDRDYGELVNWWANTKDSYTQLVDAARYGWVAKPDKLYRVKVYGIDLPALFYRKRDDGTLSFVQGGAGLPETEFTMDEIEYWHLKNCEREEVTDDDND